MLNNQRVSVTARASENTNDMKDNRLFIKECYQKASLTHERVFFPFIVLFLSDLEKHLKQGDKAQ